MRLVLITYALLPSVNVHAAVFSWAQGLHFCPSFYMYLKLYFLYVSCEGSSLPTHLRSIARPSLLDNAVIKLTESITNHDINNLTRILAKKPLVKQLKHLLAQFILLFNQTNIVETVTITVTIISLYEPETAIIYHTHTYAA